MLELETLLLQVVVVVKFVYTAEVGVLLVFNGLNNLFLGAVV